MSGTSDRGISAAERHARRQSIGGASLQFSSVSGQSIAGASTSSSGSGKTRRLFETANRLYDGEPVSVLGMPENAEKHVANHAPLYGNWKVTPSATCSADASDHDSETDSDLEALKLNIDDVLHEAITNASTASPTEEDDAITDLSSTIANSKRLTANSRLSWATSSTVSSAVTIGSPKSSFSANPHITYAPSAPDSQAAKAPYYQSFVVADIESELDSEVDKTRQGGRFKRLAKRIVA